MGRWHRVPLALLDESGRAVVEAGGEEIALFRVGEAVHAFANACPHEGNPLVDGVIAADTLTCVYHLWRFDLETGACLSGERPARTYETEVRGDDVWIGLPESAEPG